MNSRFRNYFLLVFGLFSFAGTAHAQFTAPSTQSSSAIIPPSLNAPSPDRTAAQVSPEGMVFDGAIEPHEYRLGPGDIIQYRSWTSNDAQLLMVSADQILVIPRVGEF